MCGVIGGTELTYVNSRCSVPAWGICPLGHSRAAAAAREGGYRWARRPRPRLAALGVGRVGRAGAPLAPRPAVRPVRALASGARLPRAPTFVPAAGEAPAALLQGTGGSTGFPRT